MSAAMLCERNSVFVERAMQMEVSLQHEIRDMVEWVIQPNQNLADLDPCYHQVLSKPLGESALKGRLYSIIREYTRNILNALGMLYMYD